jgi:hypothetical protein
MAPRWRQLLLFGWRNRERTDLAGELGGVEAGAGCRPARRRPTRRRGSPYTGYEGDAGADDEEVLGWWPANRTARPIHDRGGPCGPVPGLGSSLILTLGILRVWGRLGEQPATPRGSAPPTSSRRCTEHSFTGDGGDRRIPEEFHLSPDQRPSVKKASENRAAARETRRGRKRRLRSACAPFPPRSALLAARFAGHTACWRSRSRRCSAGSMTKPQGRSDTGRAEHGRHAAAWSIRLVSPREQPHAGYDNIAAIIRRRCNSRLHSAPRGAFRPSDQGNPKPQRR